MSGCYVSPIPAKIMPNYRRRVDGWPVMERQHLFPAKDAWAEPTPCNPACCRECERERSWHDHGEAA